MNWTRLANFPAKQLQDNSAQVEKSVFKEF